MRLTICPLFCCKSTFVITINNLFETPTDLTLSTPSIIENNAINDVVGTLLTTDDDAGETHTYTFESGTGDIDNGSFNISGNQLRASEVFDFESQNSYSIRIQTDDGNGGTLQKVFNISINNQSEAPTDLMLSSNDINESSPVGTTVGLLSTTDEDNGETYAYMLVSGSGDVDNASFTISGDELQSTEIFDFETKTSYSIRIQTNDGNGGILQEAFTININDLPPGLTGVDIAGSSIDENLPSGSSVGDLFAMGDEIGGVSFTFTFVSGTGDTDNGLFSISSDELLTTASFDFESANQYSIRVMADDGAGSTIAQILLIDVKDVNEAPTALDLTQNTFNENPDLGTLTSFVVADPDNGDSFTVSLISGSGDEDNTKFSVVPGESPGTFALRNEFPLDFETQSAYSIRVHVTDADGLSFENILMVFINDINDDPTGILLSSMDIDENLENNSLVGTLSTVDEDNGQTYTYLFISGEGSEDNGLFGITIDQLTLTPSADFESKGSYNIRIRTDDGNGGNFSKDFTITVNDVNDAPTDIVLDGLSIDESNPIGSEVDGSLFTTDEDLGQSHSYSLVAGTGDADNASFSISGNQLLSAEVFDFETKSSYSVLIQTDDGNGGTYEEAFTISINDLPASVTSLDLSNQMVNENETSGTLVGSFSTAGEDLSGTFTYTFASGEGDTDNSVFTISDDQLLTAQSFDLETKNSYSIRVMTDDGAGITLEQVLLVTITNVNEVPVVSTALTDVTRGSGFGSAEIDLTSTFTDPDGDGLTLTATSGTVSVVIVGIAGSTLTLTEVAPGTSVIMVTANDGNGGSVSEEFTITVNVSPNNAPTVVNAITDQVLDEGFGTADINLSEVFTDSDGDALLLTASSSDESVVTVVISGTTFTATEVGIGTSTIIITASDGNAASVVDQFTITVEELVTGIDDDLIGDIKVYPNPSTDYIKIDLPEGSWSADIYNPSGQIIAFKEHLESSNAIDVSQWKRGLYYLRLFNDNKATTTKKIIIR